MNYKLKDTFLEDGFYVTQNYMNNPAYYAQFNLLGHEGVDFGHKDKKTMVRSPLSGTVFVSVDKNYGNLCVIEDYKQQCAVYICHMTGVKVVTGQEVKAGQQLGEMDATGNSNGEHVHLNFVILKDGSNKYRLKKYNWGFLDPQYPRDTGSTVKFDGVEDYTIQWGEGEITSDPNLQQRITDLEKEVSEKNLQIKGYDEQVKGLSKKIEEITGELKTANTTSGGYLSEIKTAKETLSTTFDCKPEWVEINAKATEAVGFIDKADVLDRKLALEVKEHQADVESFGKEIAGLKTQLAGLETKYKELKDTQITPTQPTQKYSILELLKKLFGG